MTTDISELNKVNQIKSCETCKCLTCQSGKMFNSASCPKGNNCNVCNGKNPNEVCDKFKSGF